MSVVNQIEFNIDMVPRGERPVVHVSEGDIGRTYKAKLFYNGVAFTPTDVSEVEVTGLYPNDSAPAPATGSWSSGDSFVTFTLPADFCKISGQLLCEIRLKDTSDNDIGSGNFILMVERGYSENAAIVDFPTVSDAINEAVEQAQDAATSASGSATAAAASASAAAVSEQNAFSGTPDGYAALVNTVNRLSDNASATSAFMSFPKDVLANNTDLNNVLIGDWYCSSNATKNSLSNLPNGVSAVFRLQVISLTRDGVTAPTEASTWIRRVQILTDSNGKVFLRFGYREGSATSFIWGAWKSLSLT